MLTLAELLRLTDSASIRAASRYRADMFLVQPYAQEGFKIRILGVITGGTKPAKASLQLTTDTVSPSSGALVYCSCEQFKYKLEVALAARGSAKVLHADARLPTKTNPDFKPGLCPHLAFLARLSLSADTTKAAAARTSTVISPKLKK